jgi:hypothetical protein
LPPTSRIWLSTAAVDAVTIVVVLRTVDAERAHHFFNADRGAVLAGY